MFITSCRQFRTGSTQRARSRLGSDLGLPADRDHLVDAHDFQYPREHPLRAQQHQAATALLQRPSGERQHPTDAESAKLSPAASIVRCSVPPDSWAVTSLLSSATVVTSVSPDSVITGPDSPADTEARSVLTRALLSGLHSFCLPEREPQSIRYEPRCRPSQLPQIRGSSRTCWTWPCRQARQAWPGWLPDVVLVGVSVLILVL